jgi:hypothetical protein
MAISSLVPPAAESTTKTFTATTSNTLYTANADFEPGIYRVTCITSSIAVMQFFSSTGALLLTATTASGTVDVNLSTAATNVSYRVNTGSTVLVNVTLIGNVISSNAPSGTLDTITSSGTYNTTGRLWVFVLGGGGGGGSAPNSGNAGAAGGGGSIAAESGPSYYIANTATSVIIGAAGNSFNTRSTNANASNNLGYSPNANAGGTTTFGNLTSSGGAAGGVALNSNNSNPGIPGGAGWGMGSAGQAANIVAPWMLLPGTNGGGGGGGDNNNSTGQSGGGSGIGTGGTGGGTNTSATAATGLGAGGGGSGSIPANDRIPGGAGSPGVVYVLRGIY